MELFQLETFLAVAREKSFSRAASRMHRTQSAVSQTISKLEEDLGERLFDRSSRDGSLTDAGREAMAKGQGLLMKAFGARVGRLSATRQSELKALLEQLL